MEEDGRLLVTPTPKLNKDSTQEEKDRLMKIEKLSTRY
jgi:hypothetical protein